jgi:phage shock protein C
MFCTQCGSQLAEPARFCASCGAPTDPGFVKSRFEPPHNRLSRPREDAKIAGVCAGYARYLGIDVTLVRILLLFLFLWAGMGALFYIVSWIVMPRDPELRIAAAPAASQP